MTYLAIRLNTIHRQIFQDIYLLKHTWWLKGLKLRKLWTTPTIFAEYDPDAQDINPSEIFTIYKKGFNYKYAGETVVGGKKIQKIELTPQDKSKPYFKVKLDIEKASYKINNMSVLSKNGINSDYAITTFSSNLTMNDTFFKFDEKTKPGVVIIDLTKNN